MASNEKDSPISLLETLSEIDGNLEYFAVAKDGTTYKCTPAAPPTFTKYGTYSVLAVLQIIGHIISLIKLSFVILRGTRVEVIFANPFSIDVHIINSP